MGSEQLAEGGHADSDVPQKMADSAPIQTMVKAEGGVDEPDTPQISTGYMSEQPVITIGDGVTRSETEVKHETNDNQDTTDHQNKLENREEIDDKNETDDKSEKDDKDEKEKGNTAFREGRYSEAVECWKNSLRSVDYILNKNVYGRNDRQLVDVLKMKQVLQLNLCIGNLKLRNFTTAIELADSVMESDPVNSKALYRKAEAQFETGNFAGCLETAELLKARPEGAVTGEQLIRRSQKAMVAYKQKSRKMMRNLFEKLEPDERSAVEREEFIPTGDWHYGHKVKSLIVACWGVLMWWLSSLLGRFWFTQPRNTKLD